MHDQLDVADYWGSYYDKREAPVLPSQFAVFVANEVLTGALPAVGTVVDIGCGNGRDTLFFLRHGFKVRGLDRSPAAIAACQEVLKGYDAGVGSQGAFRHGPADSRESWDWLGDGGEGPVLIYARFFFHAIDQRAEAAVLAQAARLLGRRGGALCAEFRTHLDEAAAKVTPTHYRRFIVPDDFASQVQATGLQVAWRTEGRGMAKYRSDDAHVARFIAQAR
ncbi:MAG: class I SAM-dependent methyltransferase [Novosphingobium sp.]